MNPIKMTAKPAANRMIPILVTIYDSRIFGIQTNKEPRVPPNFTSENDK